MIDKIKISKTLSYALRHKPENMGITLDDNGWTNIEDLLMSFNQRGISLNRNQLIDIVETDDKQRYKISDDKIRANQGHSIGIDLELKEKVPPIELYHGTAKQNLNNIMKHGINKQKRQYVHLSNDIETANKVGSRHGDVIVLKIDTKQMYSDGYKFYQSDNDVWLTGHVPEKYIKSL